MKVLLRFRLVVEKVDEQNIFGDKRASYKWIVILIIWLRSVIDAKLRVEFSIYASFYFVIWFIDVYNFNFEDSIVKIRDSKPWCIFILLYFLDLDVAIFITSKGILKEVFVFATEAVHL